MFIKTVKVKKPKLILVVIGAIILCIIAAVLILTTSLGEKQIYTLKTETQRQEFLSEMGWEVGEAYLECKAVTIPQEFNDVYEEYNKLQKQQGFDLTEYKGKTVEVYTYQVLGYEGHEDCMIANLMVCDGVLIGGDVCCTELDGFMQGLRA